MAGCDIGDCGYKNCLDGLDNGWIRFSNFRVEKRSLLNKLGDVTSEGKYVSEIESDGKRFGMHFTSLASGRVLLARLTNDFAFQGLIAAIRYACVRKQFGPSGNETLLMDYPLH